MMKSYLLWVSEWNLVSENRMFPKKNQFLITPNHIGSNEIIRFDGVYYSIVTNEWLGEHILYEFMRFWPDGAVYGNGRQDQLPDVAYADSFSYANMGFYNVYGTNIWIDIYNPQNYVLSTGTITTNQIVLTKHLSRKHRNRFKGPLIIKEVYSFLPLPGMTRQPDWSPTGMLHSAKSNIHIIQK